jgi:hypothetical protein
MAQSYTRQSTFADGDTITAALFNDEYNQLLNAFAYSNTSAASTGHRHDGTAGEGGNIHTIGDLDFNNKIVVDSTNNRWGFYVEVSSAAVEQIRIQDGAMIPVTDSDVDLGTSSLYWKDAYIDSVTTTGNISIGGNLTVTGNATISGNLTFGDADTDSITLTADVASSITPDTDDTYDLGSASKEWRDLYIDGTANIDSLVADTADINAGSIDNTTIGATTASTGNFSTLSIGGVAITSTSAELNILDGVTATATEINIIDGDTAATATTLADADRVVVNDAGTMKQVALTDFETYFETSLDTLSNVTTVGALNSGSITSGFGAIDIGSSNITTTGTVSFGSLTDGAITITAFVDEDNMASDSATLVPTQQSVKAYVDTQIGGLSSSLSGLSDTNITSPADGALLFYDTGTSTWIDNVVSGDITIADTGVAAISSGVIVNDDINASAAISVSKTALVDGTGLTLTGDTLSVDASQTQITAVGTIATGTWQGTAIADAYVADNLTISGGTVDNSVIGGTTAAAGTFTDLTASGTLTLGGTAVTSTAAELNILDGVTATTAELNILAGVTATTAELNYTDGVTSNIQTQLDSKVGTSHTGDVDITGELLVDSYNETFKKLSSVGAIDPFRFDLVTTNSAFTWNYTQVGVAFNNDGTKAFLGRSNAFIYTITLTTPYDLSTASQTASFNAGGSISNPIIRSFTFSADGTKLLHDQQYSIGTGWKHMHQWSLTTAFDLSTASYDGSFSTGQEAFPRWNDDGTVLYTFQGNSLVVRQTVINVPYDLYGSTSRTSSNAITLSEPTNGRLQGNFFNSDGTKWATTDNTAIYVYDLSTAYDISTATFDTSITNAHNGSNQIWDMVGNPDGTAFFETANNNHGLKRYDIAGTNYTTTLDCENANVFETVLDASTTVVFSNPPASGTPVTTSYDIANGSYDSKTFSFASQETSPGGIDFSSDGTKMYVVGFATDTVYEYDLSTAWDVSTASYNSANVSVTSQETVPQSVRFADSGTKMYIVGQTNNTVYQYTLSTAYDISTASYASKSFSVSSQETAACCLFFKSDGTEMYVAGTANDTVYQYTLSTAFDVSTASYASKSFSVASQDSIPGEIAFTSDGTKMFMVGLDTDFVYQYSLSTAWDISTASYDSVSFSVASQETVPTCLAFKSDGTTMYIAGQTNDTIYQYSTSTSSLNDSTAYAMSLKVVQDADASGYTVTWPTSVDWPSATAPTLTATASAVDQFVFYTYDGGTTWYGFTAGQALG